MASLSPERTAARRIEIPAGARLDEPIVIDLDAAELEVAIEVVAGENARATIVERLSGSVAAATVRVTCTLDLAAGAELTYAALQTVAADTNVESKHHSTVGSGARVSWALAVLGGASSIDEVISRHAGRGANSDIASVFFPIDRQNVQLTTEVQHDVPSTTSQTVVRSIAAGHGRGKYFGNIRIAAHAHGSEASLRDDTLLIGKHARIDAIPALEIAANDVKAFHGATVGAIDEEHIFYIMSRGIDRDAAEKLVALGFFEPALARFPTDALRDELRAAIETKLAGARR